MRDVFPGYDVLNKRDTPSWNEQTRAVIERRLAITDEPRFFDAREWAVLKALCARIVPQPEGRASPVPVAAMVDHKALEDARDGFRHIDLPALGEAWRRGLAALDAEAQSADGASFDALAPERQDALIRAMEGGSLKHAAWGGMPCDLFFRMRVIPDVVKSYYAHPTAWSEIGFGGPASPRGYVRMDFDARDPWEAAEAKPGQENEALRENLRVGR
ncbi:gluconate 2-dehydrogenase [Alsobacter soli]|uniref:Gluconate 2-dehydrogenase n=1 Tax=Alsobacter soli TaxID=2109933 RepID=A0A2T1HXI3_9HYPH|nr:gluconate 2-dehydrogenase subunit 3 family protein [Alsobacter soli]PSC06324.1 gluconate 2-dehydrogenase [Alsobacter soli]